MASQKNPSDGYFFSFALLGKCMKEFIRMIDENNITLAPASVIFPYGRIHAIGTCG